MTSHSEESSACSSLLAQTHCVDSTQMEQAESTLIRESNSKENNLSVKEEKKRNSRWANLPDDVLELIMKRLSLKDYLGLRAICSPWRATVANAILNKHCHPLPELPLVVLNSHESYTFFNLRTERLLCPKTPLFKNMQTFHGSVEGWMIVSEYVNVASLNIFFFNPVTNARVFVPSMLNFPSNSPRQDNLLLGKMVASSRPDCSGCFLVGLFDDYCHIAFCRISVESWSTIEADKDSGVHFIDVEIIDTKLYARTDRSLNTILVFDLQDFSDEPPKPKVLAMIPVPQVPPPVSRLFGNIRFDRGNLLIFLAKDDAIGELFLIYMFCNSAYETHNVGYMNLVMQYVTPPTITRVDVFKLNTSNETNQWIKVDNLGDRVMFLGGNKCLVMSRAALNSTEELIAGNSIYFIVEFHCPANPRVVFRLGMISLTDNSIKYKYFSLVKSSPFPPNLSWFVPSV
ncbi:uncharacterized protein LOC133292193 [Gastrolobium bilobum]|uniref:uncharacterized protein LOC133292193 n=1 Tax=Gastrolobium bilobum TaxID=150636 RepID=UPI002AB1D82E|nr:uncharacterized protein LOC133292193 [Gastrolobium bilobum]